jgi:hypothetical protein
MPSIMRRMRMRLPTCTSVGFGAFVVGLAMAATAMPRPRRHPPSALRPARIISRLELP